MSESVPPQANQQSVLVTGGAGFFGGILKRHVLDLGYRCVSLDILPDEETHPNLRSVQVDLRDPSAITRALEGEKISTVFHCAAMLAHDVKDKDALWKSNVDGTRNVAQWAVDHGAGKIIFISSNCLWGSALGRPVREDDEPRPIEVYGKSKWAAEKVLAEFADRIPVATIRPPTIVDAGRLGLLAILFEFIDENRRVWVVGSGGNRYQFIYASDLANACVLLSQTDATGPFNIGSDNVKSLREIYQYVIDKAHSKARVASLPQGLTLLGMRIAYLLGISPLGPYHYRMIAEDFVFDTSRLKSATSWQPTLTNEEMLFEAYAYYQKRRAEIESRTSASAHRQAARLGVIRLLKWLS